MLRYLRIRDFALIRNLGIDFGEGLTVLTGETGSGKSIIVDAFGLLIGGRSSQEMVRANCDVAILEGVFSVEGDGALRLVETRFPSYGAGLPFQATGKSDDGKWMVAPGGQRLLEFSFFISPINRASLRVGAKTLDLTTVIDSGDVVAVAVRRYPRLLMLLVCL